MTDLARAVAAGARPGPRVQPAVVRSVAATLVTVELDGVDVPLPVLSGVYTVGDTVLVLRDGPAGGWVLGRLGQPVAPPPPPPAPPVPVVPAPSTRTAVVLPGWTGTWRGSSWRDTMSLYQGDYSGHGVNAGAAFYGDAVRALGVDTIAARSAQLTYRRARGGTFGATAPTFVLLAERTRTAAAPVRTASAAGTAVPVDGVTSWPVPTPWLDALVAGTAGGIGIYVAGASPYVVLTGQPTDPRAMALTITYVTT